MAVELDVLDAPDIAARVHEDAAAQHAAIHAADAMAHIAFGAEADAVVAVDECDVLDRVVVALQMKRPRVVMNVGDDLLGIKNRDAAHGGGMAEFKERRPVFVVASTGGKDDRTRQRLGPNR